MDQVERGDVERGWHGHLSPTLDEALGEIETGHPVEEAGIDVTRDDVDEVRCVLRLTHGHQELHRQLNGLAPLAREHLPVTDGQIHVSNTSQRPRCRDYGPFSADLASKALACVATGMYGCHYGNDLRSRDDGTKRRTGTCTRGAAGDLHQGRRASALDQRADGAGRLGSDRRG